MQSTIKHNQYALVTGATSGFGYEFSKLLATNGYNLILVGRSLEKLRDVAETLTEQNNVKIILLPKDLFHPEAPKEIYRTIKDLGIEIDILINDAGKSEYGKFMEYDIDRDVDIIQQNITALVSLTKYFLKDMIARNGGKILQVSSLLGSYPTPLMSVYTAAKAFVLAFTHGLINELKGSNVSITALMPGLIDSDFLTTSGQQRPNQAYHQLSVPEEVAREGFNAMMKGESKILAGYNEHKNEQEQLASHHHMRFESSAHDEHDPGHLPDKVA